MVQYLPSRPTGKSKTKLQPAKAESGFDQGCRRWLLPGWCSGKGEEQRYFATALFTCLQRNGFFSLHAFVSLPCYLPAKSMQRFIFCRLGCHPGIAAELGAGIVMEQYFCYLLW